VRRSKPPPVAQSTDGRAEFEALDGDMTVTLTVTPPTHGGTPVNPSEVLEALWDAGIAHGLDEGRVRSLIARSHELGGPVTGVVASGTPPEPGTPSRFEVLVQPTQRPVELDSGLRGAGLVDYHFERPILNVHEGQEVARKAAATEGLPGIDVFGRPVPPPPAPDRAPRPTFRVTAQEDGAITRYLAAESGELRVDEPHNTVYILTEYMHRGDVTMAQGDIVFVRDVAVIGNIGERAVVRAGGNVQITGLVGAATIEAGGKVTVSQGIVGGGRGLVSAGGDVDAAFAENATIRSGGNVIIRKGALNSDISARGSVVCNQGRGSIVGGSTRAGRLVDVRRLGAPASVQTEVVVGLDWALLERRDELRAEIGRCVENMRKFDQSLGPITVDDQLTRFPQEIRANIAKAVRQRVALAHHLEELRAELASILADLAASPGGVVRVLGDAYPGVKVRVRDAQTVITEALNHCLMVEDRQSGGVRIGTLS